MEMLLKMLQHHLT